MVSSWHPGTVPAESARWLTVPDLVDLLGLSPGKVHRLLEDRHLLELDEREVDSRRKRQYRNLGIGILDSILCIYFRPINRCSHVALSCDDVFLIG